MAAFSVNLTESVSVQDYLLGGGNFGFGNSSFLPTIFSSSFGHQHFVGSQNSPALGHRLEYLHRANGHTVESNSADIAARLNNIQGQSAFVSGNFFDPESDSADTSWGLDQTRNLTESNTIADTVSVNGTFIRSTAETLDIFARVGHSKGLYLRANLSGVVSSNSQVRSILETPGTGEIAVSERPISGPLKALRFIPGSTFGTPNTANLTSVPTTTGSQGFIFDASPQGVLLRGAWQVKLVVIDTQASGSVQLAVNMHVVKASPTGVSKQFQIGTTKLSTAFTPSTTPTQLTFDWLYGEVGEIYVNSDEYFYLEAFVQEVSHPTSIGYSRLGLSNLLNTEFSQVSYPGVTNESTETVFVPAETVVISDLVSYILGFNRSLTESNTFSDTVTRNFGAYRQISESISIVALLQAWKNALIENVVISDSVNRVVANIRTLIESVVVSDTAVMFSNSPKTLIETIVVQDHATYSITRGDERERERVINKRPLDNLARRRRNKLV